MGVYVDKLAARGWRMRGRLISSCHLLADGLGELHRFAQGIGLKRRWFQDNGRSLQHYDLTEGKRAQAVANGAQEIDRAELVRRIRSARAARNVSR